MIGMGLSMVTQNGVTGESTPPSTNSLTMTFPLAHFPVVDPASVSQWNTFFDTSNEADMPFHTAILDGNSITLIGAVNLNVKTSRFAGNDYMANFTDVDTVTSIGISAFENCFSMETAIFPVCTTVGDRAFNTCIALTTIDLENCTQLGSTTGDNLVFQNIIGNTIDLTIDPSIETDGDILYLEANNTVTLKKK